MEPELSAQIVSFIARANDTLQDVHDWSTGTATGGPGEDGLYPIRNLSGQSNLALSPAGVAARMPTGQPFDWLFECYATREMVRVATGLSPQRAPRALILSEIRVSVDAADVSPSQTYGLRMNVRVNGASILSSPVRILPGQLSSKAEGTPQPVIATPRIPDDALVTWDVELEGSGAQGLKGYLKGHYE
ncbi:hypothetical protein [Sphingomonas sp. SORGH_AS_0879]|uniref:hypothetical protein n=1 Tax=Sphingomonas sp. SORGH_AS_0879 TaxID=3041790 RepID=UPI002780B73F|nr:hypothetical protein [Sphingomonas sp. SORGH_AS_0879]MDQ1229266.1 hypothetical protein [Sphingomonas sp. SORGH_AS_0879]